MIIELERTGEHSIVYWQHGDTKEYVVCTGFDDSKPEGSKWYWGYYFNNLYNAVTYFKETYGKEN